MTTVMNFKKTIIITLIFMLMALNAYAIVHSQMRFDHHLIEGGRESIGLGGGAVVNKILQDEDGFMWFVEYTNKRLLRYDGHNFKPYLIEDASGIDLQSRVISAATIDNQGRLWIGTSIGLYLYNKNQERFQAFLIESDRENFLQSIDIHALETDEEGRLYIGGDEGLSIIDTKKSTLQHFYPKEIFDSNIIDGEFILKSIHAARDGSIWLGASHGLAHFFPAKNKFEYWRRDADNPKSLISNDITRVRQDRNGNIWVASMYTGISRLNKNGEFSHYLISEIAGKAQYDSHYIYVDSHNRVWAALDKGGLAYYSPADDSFKFIKHQLGDTTSLSSNVVRTIFEDRQKNLWLGMYPSGIDFFNYSSAGFTTIKHNPANPDSVSDNGIICIHKDTRGVLWICTENGLNRFNEKDNTFIHFQGRGGEYPGLRSNTIMNVSEDSKGNFWVPTWDGGIHYFDRNKLSFKNYILDENNPNSFSGVHAWPSLIDSQGRLWAGTLSQGLNLYNPRNDGFIRYKNNPDNPSSLSSNSVMSLLEKDSNSLWVGTVRGLNILDIEKGEFRLVENFDKFYCRTLYQDSKNNLWIGSNSGAFIYNSNTSKITSITKKDGLPSNVIRLIIEDDHGNIWLGSRNGLALYDVNTKEITTFFKSDGLSGNNYYHNAAYKDEKGKLYLGTTEGISVFDPTELTRSENIASIVYTGFKINNKDVKPGEKSPLKTTISVAEEIVLNHSHKMFTFEFSLLSMESSYLNEYAYMLEGFDKNWQNVGKQNSAN